jgi:hypothetical protein
LHNSGPSGFCNGLRRRRALGGRHSRIAVEDWIGPLDEITIGRFPDAIAITPDGTMAYVAKPRSFMGRDRRAVAAVLTPFVILIL